MASDIFRRLRIQNLLELRDLLFPQFIHGLFHDDGVVSPDSDFHSSPRSVTAFDLFHDLLYPINNGVLVLAAG
jgi:hypothetical protein